jgi:glycerophosphoryl diester phosphodiesterase
MQLPPLIAHRGASADAPENTLAALEEAWRQGADGAEIDLRCSADGRLIALHDEGFERTCGLPGRLREVSAADLVQLDATGRRPGFAPEPPPRLEDILAATPAERRLLLELKEGPEQVAGLRRALAGQPRREVDLISFRLDTLEEVRRRLPGRPAWWLLAGRRPLGGDALARACRMVRQLDLAGLDVQAELCDEAFAVDLSRAGLPWMAWTVDAAPLARRLISLGVAALTTNRPGALRRELGAGAEGET